ncbi:MAG: hypothetical protein ABI679_14950 [Gemmatimonadota bacterium]
MPRSILAACMAILISACAGPWRSVVAPVPQSFERNALVQVWAGERSALLYGVLVRNDSVIGTPLGSRQKCHTSERAWSLASVDSIRIRKGNRNATTFGIGFAVGAYLMWRLLVGSLLPI